MSADLIKMGMDRPDLRKRLKALAPLLVAAGLILWVGPASEVAASAAAGASYHAGPSDQQHQAPEIPLAVFPSESIPGGNECESSSGWMSRRPSAPRELPDRWTTLPFSFQQGTVVPFYCLLCVYRL